MESELTYKIKRNLENYRPLMPGASKTIRWAEEVQVLTGVVDFIRFEDYVSAIEQKMMCYGEKYQATIESKNKHCLRFNNECNKCDWYQNLDYKHIDIACTCFEIKISKSDFKSVNGHNFVGNYNYYVIPTKLYEKVVDLIPKTIGVITFNDNRLRERKKPTYIKINPELKMRYMYNAFKKWVDCKNNTFINENKIKTLQYKNAKLIKSKK